MNRFDDLARRALEILLDRGICTLSSVLACTDAHISEIETAWRCRLPAAYRAFLKTMGRGAGRFYLGSDHFYPRIVELPSYTAELLQEDRSEVELPERAIVFSMHQGYQFLFMADYDLDDPPVHYYMKNRGQLEHESDRFSDYLLSAVCDNWGTQGGS